MPATTRESTISPSTSSITAAPRIVEPAFERSCPTFIKVCAVIVTLVAVRIVPRKTASGQLKPNLRARKAPVAIGSTTPPAAAQKAADTVFFIMLVSVSSPATNISKTTPISASTLNTSAVETSVEPTG